MKMRSLKARAAPRYSKTVVLPYFRRGSRLRIDYPGKKGDLDFRVTLERSSGNYILSHVNIIVDLYWKAHYRQHQISSSALTAWLHGLFRSGPVDVPKPSYDADAIPDKVRCFKAKSYDPRANELELDLEELSFATAWIALQEEINYPQPRFDGMRRPLLVYIEIVHFGAMDERDAMRGLRLSIQRALLHERLPLLPCVNYGDLTL